jgi:hypothetical protein
MLGSYSKQMYYYVVCFLFLYTGYFLLKSYITDYHVMLKCTK